MPSFGNNSYDPIAAKGRIAPTPAAKLKFSVVSHDLREEEALHATLDSLSNLSNLASTIMGAVSARIREERTSLDALRSRIGAAREKIKRLEGTPRPTRVFSSAKFPASEGCGVYSPLLGDRPYDALAEAEGLSPASLHLQRRIRSSPTSAGAGSDFSIPWSLVSISPKPSSAADAARLSREGLGRLPGSLTSVSAMLLFNTSENPYRTYTELDNLAGMAEVLVYHFFLI